MFAPLSVFAAAPVPAHPAVRRMPPVRVVHVVPPTPVKPAVKPVVKQRVIRRPVRRPVRRPHPVKAGAARAAVPATRAVPARR